MAETTSPLESDDSTIEGQAQQQTGQQQVRLRIDQRDMHTSYANAFRTNATAEELIVDFGLNQLVGAQRQSGQTGSDEATGEIVFQLSNRVIMNYYSAKRLVLSLGGLITRYEEQFGELKLDVAKRTSGGGSGGSAGAAES